MKVLITGATGFIGQNVTSDLIPKGPEIALLVRDTTKIKNLDLEKVHIIEGSLESLSDCKSAIKNFNPDVCLHLAWQGIPDYSYEVSKKNLNQSIEMVDFLLEQTHCKKIIVSGSCFEYGKAQGCLTEIAKEENLSAIAWAKNSLKHYLELRCKEKNIDWIWLRIFYVFGPGQRENALIPSLFHAAQKDLPSPIKNPNHANDFVYISDVSDAILKACYNNIESGVYNIGSGYLSSVAEMWTLVQKYTFRLKSNNKEFIQTTCGGINNNTLVGGYADIEKAKKNLNWTPKISTQEGVKKFIAHLLNQEKI